MAVISNELKDAILSEDIFTTEEILEQIEKDENGAMYIEELMELMSENPSLDYGVPGPIVYFIESFDTEQYIDILLRLEETKPNIYFNGMLNSIINITEGDLKDKYIAVLQKVSQMTDIEEYIRDNAQELVEFQLG